MIGNDIVDLKLARTQSNWKRKGFLNKIFTEDEQALIRDSVNPFQLVWLFWSMKESAYKITVQKYQHRFFAPKKFRCTLFSETQGLVVVKNEQYITNAAITADYIFTEAVEAGNNTIEHNYFKVSDATYSEQSKTVHHKLRKMISKKNKLPMHTLHIKKNGAGVPELYSNNEQLNVSISISHHGDYGAYSILNTSK